MPQILREPGLSIEVNLDDLKKAYGLELVEYIKNKNRYKMQINGVYVGVFDIFDLHRLIKYARRDVDLNVIRDFTNKSDDENIIDLANIVLKQNAWFMKGNLAKINWLDREVE